MKSNCKYIFVTVGLPLHLVKAFCRLIGQTAPGHGFRVTIQKPDPYINVDPGTLNPYEHGANAM